MIHQSKEGAPPTPKDVSFEFLTCSHKSNQPFVSEIQFEMSVFEVFEQIKQNQIWYCKFT